MTKRRPSKSLNFPKTNELIALTLITLIYEHYSVASLDVTKTIIPLQQENKNGMNIEVEAQVPLMTLPNTA